MTFELYHEIIRVKADEYDIPTDVVYGVCMAESRLNRYAVRYEPKYRYLCCPEQVKPSDCSLETEISLQKTSWGIMQVMGGLARSLGFRGWLTELVCSPLTQIDLGCQYLSGQIKRYGDNDGIAAYNTGKPRYSDGVYVNQAYFDRVLKYAKRWTYDNG